MAKTKRKMDYNEYWSGENATFDQPVVSPLVQELPLEQLHWKTFEHLCCRLVERENGIVANSVHLYGVEGDNQEGIDIVAQRTISDKSETWCYQCKKHEYFSPGEFETAIKNLSYSAQHYTFFISSNAQKSLREIEGEYHYITLLDRSDISRKLKYNRDLVAEFFHASWVDLFIAKSSNEIQSENVNYKYNISGTVYRKDNGQPIPGTRVQIILNDRCYETRSNDTSGKFSIGIDEEGSIVRIIASNYIISSGMSTIQAISWEEAIEGDIRIHLDSEVEFRGNLLWGGSQAPIPDAELSVKLFGEEYRSSRSSHDGKFAISIPNNGSYLLQIKAPNAVTGSILIEHQIISSDVHIYLARNCSQNFCEEIIVQRICDDLEIDMVRVTEGEFRMGPPSGFAVGDTKSYYISRFPISCLQYSYYLQLSLTAPVPEGWINRFSPIGKERHPITGITWHEAISFCEWLSGITHQKYRLPSEVEWEKAARGPADARSFPWGDDSSQLKLMCNSLEGRANKVTPVDNFPLGRSPYGAWDMVGNVWEWTESVFASDVSNEEDGTDEQSRVLRGGSYRDSVDEVTCYNRIDFSPHRRNDFTGFRVVRILGDS